MSAARDVLEAEWNRLSACIQHLGVNEQKAQRDLTEVRLDIEKAQRQRDEIGEAISSLEASASVGSNGGSNDSQ